MPLVHVDVLTPKQVLFFREVRKKLKENGFSTLLTTRSYREVNGLLKLHGIQAISVGRHGGPTLEGKVRAGLERTKALIDVLVSKAPDFCLSFSSPEAARASFGLGIPHICISDSPHAKSVSALTVPLSSRLISPKIIPKGVWSSFGISPKKIVTYDALDPVVWMRKQRSSAKDLPKLDLDTSKPLVVVRTPETQAAYMIDSAEHEQHMFHMLGSLTEKLVEHASILVLPRYVDQAYALKRKFGKRITISNVVLNGTALLSKASVFVGGGGTMTAEAALFGLPNFSYYSGPRTYVENFLVKKRLTRSISSPRKLANKVKQVIINLENEKTVQKKRAFTIMRDMEDPADKVVEVLNRF